MFEDVRRSVARARESRATAKLKALEKGRRLSFIKMRRLEGVKAAEEELTEQVGAERAAREAARQAQRERRQAVREMRGPGIGERTARAAKSVFYTAPVKTLRVASRLTKGANLHKVLVGDTHFVLGTPRQAAESVTRPSMSLHETIFGPSTKTLSTAPRKKEVGILDIDPEILR